MQRVVITAAFVLTLTGCATTAEDERVQAFGTTGAPMTSEPRQQVQPSTPSPLTQATATAEQVSEPQILALLRAVNQGEIDEAKVAQGKATDPQVKQFADTMVADHGQMLDDERRLAAKLSLTPMESAKSRELEQGTKSKIEELKNLSGADLDKKYIENQVNEHAEGLTLIRSTILPNVKTAELRTLIKGTEAKVSKHLSDARDIQHRIAPAVSQR